MVIVAIIVAYNTLKNILRSFIATVMNSVATVRV
jgi:hypothetical protein